MISVEDTWHSYFGYFNVLLVRSDFIVYYYIFYSETV